MNRAATKEYRAAANQIAKADPTWLMRTWREPTSYILENKRAQAIIRRALIERGLL